MAKKTNTPYETPPKGTSGHSTLPRIVAKQPHRSAIGLAEINASGFGLFNLDVPFPAGVINRNSAVLANICEIARTSAEPGDLPWVGAANMTIWNIVPQDTGHVILRVEVDWSHPLDFRIQFAILGWATTLLRMTHEDNA